MDYLEKLIEKYGADIINSKNFLSSGENTQHGSVSVKEHSLDVAKSSLVLCDFLRIKCNKRDLIRGALLHDYFLYDWHKADENNPHRLHGFYHPGTALRNASKEYILTERQKDIIKKHMWPLTIVPPVCREAWIVTTADKYCSFRETLHFRKGDKSAV